MPEPVLMAASVGRVPGGITRETMMFDDAVVLCCILSGACRTVLADQLAGLPAGA